MTNEYDHDVENLFLSITNERGAYKRLCILGRGYMNAPDSEWANEVRYWARQMVREGRATRRTLTATVIAKAAAKVRDYYIAHVKESGQ